MHIELERARDPWLFDNVKDPVELHNPFATPDGPLVLPALLKRLKRPQAREAS